MLTRLMLGIYSIDTNTNVFPSVHVVGSIGAALAAWDYGGIRKRRWFVWSITILSALICLSVVFVKQHGVLDLLGGFVLGLLLAIPVYHPKSDNKKRPAQL
jgi:membrane-associated phospholipid phosphatase